MARSQPPLVMASMMASSMDAFVRAIGERLAADAGVPIRVLDDVPWTARAEAIERGAVDIAWTCGLWYVRARAGGAPLDALAAPVFDGPRYADQPVYFADLLVRHDAPYTDLASLRGSRFGFNDPGSFSGLAMLRARLEADGMRDGLFGAAIETGSHDASLHALIDGQIDAATIDSSVLDRAAMLDPRRVRAVRAVATLGPWPSPPVSTAPTLEPHVRRRLLALLRTLPEALTALAPVIRFEPIEHAAYDAIRRAGDAAERARLVAPPSPPG